MWDMFAFAVAGYVRTPSRKEPSSQSITDTLRVGHTRPPTSRKSQQRLFGVTAMPTARFWDLKLKDGAITVARSRFDAAYRVLLTKAEKRAYLTRPCFPVAGACAEVLAGDHAGSVGITGVPEGTGQQEPTGESRQRACSRYSSPSPTDPPSNAPVAAWSAEVKR